MVLLAFFLVQTCDSKREIAYYSRAENYKTISGTISYINYNEDKTGLYFECSDLETPFTRRVFKIVGENLSIVQNKRIDEKVNVGTIICFTAAPKVFGDAYVIPIVQISVGEEELLGFEEGQSNLLKWLNDR